MKIAVLPITPLGSGNTTVSMLVALTLANLGKSVCLAHTSPISKAYYQYLGLDSYEDRTCTPSQLVKLIQKSNIHPEEMHDYCKQAAPNLEIFTNTSKTFTTDDMMIMHENMANIFPHDSVIFDIDNLENLDDVKRVVSNCDVVLLTITQSITDLENFRENSKQIMDICQDKSIVTVVNKYNSLKMSIKEMTKAMGLKKPNNWLSIHDNPKICQATNHGKLVDLAALISQKNPEVIELNAELSKIANTLIKANFAKIKQINHANAIERQKASK